MYARQSALILTLVALAVPAAPAQASFTGLERIGPFTATTSAAKSVTATCPAGKRIVGLGGDTTPGNGRVLIDRIRPSADLTSVTLHANEDQAGTTDAWYLQSFVICAPAPAGLERVSATSPSNSSNKSVAATCPTGKFLLGSSAEITGAPGEVILDGLVPGTGLQSVTVNALEDEGAGTSLNWSITAYAICAPKAAGLQRVAVTGSSDSTSSKIATADCPVGKSVIGVYGTINSPNGQVVLDSLFPNIAMTSANIAAAEDGTGNTANWSLTAYAVCASTTELVTVAPPGRGTSGGAGFQGSCPAGKLPAGVGGDITGGFGRMGIQALRPGFGSANEWRTSTMSDPSATIENWSLAAQGICTTAIAGQEVVGVLSLADSTAEKSVTAACPAGKRVIGGGGAIGTSDFAIQRILTGVTPNSALTTVTATGHEDEAGYGQDWTVVAYAVCAAAPAGLQRVTATSPLGSDEFSQASVNCPVGKHMLGIGGTINGGAGQVLIDDLKTNAALSKATITGFEDTAGFDADWNVTAYAICVTR